MDTDLGAIPARTRRQAFDWSLVLASQSIENTITKGDGDARWNLLVPRSQYDRALDSIRNFTAENRASRWQTRLPWTGQFFELGAVPVWWVIAFIHAVTTSLYFAARTRGEMNSALVLSGEWWRLFTAVSLHGDLAHLMSNLSLGVIFLGLAMARFGSGWGLLAAFWAGAMGNVAGLLLYPNPYHGLGASGMVMGSIGLLALHSVSLLRRAPQASRYVITGLLGGTFLFVMLGTNPASDLIGHAGGFAAGVLFGGILALLSQKWIKATNRMALLVATGSFLITWALALFR